LHLVGDLFETHSHLVQLENISQHVFSVLVLEASNSPSQFLLLMLVTCLQIQSVHRRHTASQLIVVH